MVTPEEDVEAHALRKMGWSISAIARHLGRDRKTVRDYLAGKREMGVRRRPGPDTFEPVQEYIRVRLTDDPHVWATALYDEVGKLGYDMSYPSFVREIRNRRLRPHCEACAGVKGRPTIEIEHRPGEEIQWDWVELPAPWGGDAHLLNGALSYSSKARGVFAETEEQPQLVEAIDGVLRRLGGTAKVWRFDRMGTVVNIGTDHVLASFAAVAKYYGVGLAICPARHGNRKGVVEKQNDFSARRWWRTANVSDRFDAQLALDHFQTTIGDSRPRGDSTVGKVAATEPLLELPAHPYPATVVQKRIVDDHALVAYNGNKYAVLPGMVGTTVEVRQRLGSGSVEVFSAARVELASHRLRVPGAGEIVRTEHHLAALEEAVLAAFSTAPACRRKDNRPPSPEALAIAAQLAGMDTRPVTVDLDRYAEWAQVTR